MSAVGSQDIAREAAQWLMRLTEDDASPADRDRLRTGFDAWKRQDPRHDAAARRMEAVLTQLGALRDDAAGQTTPLHAGLKVGWAGGRQRRIRRVAAALALAAALATPLAVFLHFYPSSYLLADMRSGARQWQTHVLADQSRVTLEPGTAVNLHFDPQRREVELVRGDILVEVAHDATRPFVVRTAQGSVRALGTRFVVSAESGVTVLSMLESKVLATARDDTAPDHARQVQAGEQVRITAQGVGAPQRLAALPDVPTLAQLGHAQANLDSLFGLFAPPQMAPALAQRINAAVAQALRAPGIGSRLEAASNQPFEGSAAEFAQQVMREAGR